MTTTKIPQTLLLATLLIQMTSCQLGRFVFYNFADIHDHKKFPSRALHSDSVKFNFYATDNGRFPKKMSDNEQKGVPFDKYLEDHKTVAFVIIKNDTIQYEKYFKGYNQESIVPSFSMAKSVTSILIGCAIDEGLINAVEEPITNYIPELKENGFEKVTIKHLLQMTSGLKFNESYFNPFGDKRLDYHKAGENLRQDQLAVFF